MYKRFLGLAVGVLLGWGVSGEAGATTISTVPSWSSGAGIGLGNGGVATIGQTFVAPVDDAVLNSFTFWTSQLHLDSDSVEYEAFVMKWDGTKAVGPILFQSAALATTATNWPGYEEIEIDTGDLALTGGSQYVAFFSVSNLLDGVSEFAYLGFVGTDSYADGSLVLANNGSDFGALTSSDWITGGGDLAFVMSFGKIDNGVEVPEPAPMAMLGLGLIGLAWMSRRRMTR